MGISGVGIWQVLIVLVLAVLLFGSGKIRRLGEDLGGAISGFRRSLHQNDKDGTREDSPGNLSGNLLQAGERE
ncbi:twin-arginine translocase TatA/TatE family subunit [Microbulbifer sp. JMSA004]|uniref:twin-arginine translocase TatA/TatE family subunit n=1 Tax=Microbulbifer sp. JMSA004 TaxID=3243370 RepID=UPI00403980F1